MGVDFYACNYCGETFCDVGDFVSCDCGNKWCCEECAKEEGFTEEIKNEYGEGTCKYCREEDFIDSELLEYALVGLKLTREELITMYKSEKE